MRLLKSVWTGNVKLVKNTWKNNELLLMALPAIVLLIMFKYIPMFGLSLAFKNFNYADGIWRSPWCGFENFRYLFMNGELVWRLVRNTVGYYFLFTVTGQIFSIAVAICINEMVFKRLARYLQSAMILPTFISYIAISYILYAFLESDNGIINNAIASMGGEKISFYLESKWWPIILLVVRSWKNVGYGSVLYLSVLVGIDQGLYEAADIDGASPKQKLWYITIPMLTSMVIINVLLNLGHIMNSDTGLFYQVTKNSTALYPTTQVLDSYVLVALSQGIDYGRTAAVTFFQSIVGFIMVIVANLSARKYAPESALF